MNLLDKLEAINHWNTAAKTFLNIVDYKGSKIGYLQSEPLEQTSLDHNLFVDDPTFSQNSDGSKSKHSCPTVHSNSPEVFVKEINTNSESSPQQEDSQVEDNLQDCTLIPPEDDINCTGTLVNTDENQPYAQNITHSIDKDANCCLIKPIQEAPDVQNQSTHLQSDSTGKNPENLLSSLEQLVPNPFCDDTYQMHSSGTEKSYAYDRKHLGSNEPAGSQAPMGAELDRDCTNAMIDEYDLNFLRDSLYPPQKASDISCEIDHGESREVRYFEFDDSEQLLNIIDSFSSQGTIPKIQGGDINAHLDSTSQEEEMRRNDCLFGSNIDHAQSNCEWAAQDVNSQQQPVSNISSDLYSSSSLSNSMSNQSELVESRIYANNKSFPCELCGKAFSSKGTLNRHKRSHGGEKLHQCDHCDAKFTEKKSLKIHMRKHTGERPYRCEFCDKDFTQAGVLKDHVAVHLNERRFLCTMKFCNKSFRQRSQLKTHMMRHNEIKNFECSNCGSRFSRKCELDRHFKTHTAEKAFDCKYCGKSFTRRRGLNEHVPIHFKRKPKNSP